jgi:hypothetical protein
MTPPAEEAAAIASIAAEVKGLSRRFDEHATRTHEDLSEIKSDLKETKSEVKRTNGRVTHLELEAEREGGESEARRGLLSATERLILLLVACVSGGAAVLAIFIAH